MKRLKIDHLVVNVDASVQEDKEFIGTIHEMGLPYEPKWGKGTKGFKVSNIWIGKQYFELVRIKKPDGGGWVKSWTDQYNKGHRGLIGFALDVHQIDEEYKRLIKKKINISLPEPLKFRWFFNLFTRTMPWQNAYIAQLQGVPFQFFLQQMNDEKSRTFMEQYMVPNSTEHQIDGISEIIIYGQLTIEDKKLLKALFDHYEENEQGILIQLGSQTIRFKHANTYKVDVHLKCNNQQFQNKKVSIHNVQIINS